MGLYQGDKPLSSVGKSPAAYAKDAGYTGTDDNFYTALAGMPDHLSDQENPHGTTAQQVGADVAGAADEALNSAKAYTDQTVAGVIPGEDSKESPTDSDSLFIYDNADSGKPKKTLISKLVELFNNTFYTKTEIDTTLQNKADKSVDFTVTLTAEGWADNVQTISNEKFVSTGYAYTVAPASGSFTNYAEAMIYADDVTTDGQMVFHCDSAPTADLTVNIVRMVTAE